MKLQDEIAKIHNQYGTSEMANYNLQLLAEQYAKDYHESEVKIKLSIGVILEKFAEWLHDRDLRNDSITSREWVNIFLKTNNLYSEKNETR